MNRNFATIIVISITTILLVGWILLSPSDYTDQQKPDLHNKAQEHGQIEEEITKGPHGGRLLSEDDFSLEVTIFETGLPPEFRVYVYDKDQPIVPDNIKLTIQLKRLGNVVDHIQFIPQQDYLRGDTVVYEPHSFEVTAKAIYKGNPYSWLSCICL